MRNGARAYRWPPGKRCAVAFTSDVDGESPYLWQHRDKPMVQVETLDQRRFGPRVGIYRLLDLLDEFGVKGSFYVPGLIAEQYPGILPELAERGHEAGLHGYCHESVADLDAAENRAVVERSLKIFAAQVGTRPRGYRAPYWHVTTDLIATLVAGGFAYDSSLMGYDHPYVVDGLLEIPVLATVADTTYFRCTGGPADKTYPPDPGRVLDLWIEVFEGMREFGGLYTITVHPWISGHGHIVRMLRRLFEHIRQYDDVWWATALELAEYHRASDNADAYTASLQPPEGAALGATGPHSPAR